MINDLKAQKEVQETDNSPQLTNSNSAKPIFLFNIPSPAKEAFLKEPPEDLMEVDDQRFYNLEKQPQEYKRGLKLIFDVLQNQEDLAEK